MKVPQEIIDKYKSYYKEGEIDPETDLFLDIFDEDTYRVVEGTSPVIKQTKRVLEIGSRDEVSASMLADMGFQVTTVDLREFKQPNPIVRHTVCDFCDPQFYIDRKDWDYQSFDVIYSISTLEHFGLNVYKEHDNIHQYYDVIAARKIWEYLRDDGVCYLTVPFGGKFVTHRGWRVYDWASIMERLVQDFVVEFGKVRVCEKFLYAGREMLPGEDIDIIPALQNLSGFPFNSIGLKLRKVPVVRKVD